MSEPADVAGLVLAAGEGRRMGRPKALVTTDGTPWLARAVDVLRDAGCAPVVVVLGAASEQARALVPDDVAVVVAPDFASGASASLRAGLAALGGSTAWGALVHLVDLPDVGPDVARRVLGAATGPSALARAVHDGTPGHPVLIGRDHWAPVAATVRGDAGAGAYLAAHGALEVECGDLATGIDVDRPPRNSL
ncbi:nucleotidyltransferase family protein [Aeromicrobium halocynthiae]|uniref:Nucleotidyltransferase family protein n=1 Tax=Aeromicrobium halocynthiae TaxID=560557 RepID=A0ABN2VZG9_9ACTN